MELLNQDEIATGPDFGHRLRQLRWFRKSFQSSAYSISNRHGLAVFIDQEKLARVFIDWVDALDSKKQFASVNRADFIIFAGGLALAELMKTSPATVVLPTVESSHPVSEIMAFWPEGFLYTNYCISAVMAVYHQEFNDNLVLSSAADDLRTWGSFKENTHDMPAYAVAFFDRFFGLEPDWTMPDHPDLRMGMRLRLGDLH